MKKYFLLFLLFLLFSNLRLVAQTLTLVGKDGQLQPIQKEQRIALVIGNQNYNGGSWTPLRNPINDAQAMKNVLQEVGFDVICVEDGSKQQMLNALNDLTNKIRSLQTVVLVFYAGHGIASDNKNWFIPIDDPSKCPVDIPLHCISLNFIQTKLKDAGAAFLILISDACRTNDGRFYCPMAGRGLPTIGFTRFQSAKGHFIAYSTDVNQIASDGKDSTAHNSPYTHALVQAIRTPNLSIEDVFKQVARAFIEEEEDKQTPTTSSKFFGNFYFKQSKDFMPPMLKNTIESVPQSVNNTTIPKATPKRLSRMDDVDVSSVPVEKMPKPKPTVEPIRIASNPNHHTIVGSQAVWIELTDKGIEEGHLFCNVKMTNTTDKGITGIRGHLYILDENGQELHSYSVYMNTDETLNANSVQSQKLGHTFGSEDRYDQFNEKHRLFKNADLSKLKTRWEPTQIVFADDTSWKKGK